MTENLITTLRALREKLEQLPRFKPGHTLRATWNGNVIEPLAAVDGGLVNRDEVLAELDTVLAQATAPQETLERLTKENHILKLAIPLEDELAGRIDEMLKYLAMQDGFTLNGIARLFVEVQRRMASDWVEIGQLRREVKALRGASVVSRSPTSPERKCKFCNDTGKRRDYDELVDCECKEKAHETLARDIADRLWEFAEGGNVAGPRDFDTVIASALRGAVVSR